MRVTLLGTGCPVSSPRRGGAATLVETVRARVLVDCGSMVTQRLIEAGRPGATIDALLVSHLHSDHLVDFYQMLVSSWHQGRAAPWQVYCPETVIPVIEATMEAWRNERELRVAFEQRPSATGLEVACTALAPDQRITVGDIEIVPVQVDHGPVRPAFGFVFRAGGRNVVLSGDTTACDALVEASQGPDLLVHEVFIHREMPPVARHRRRNPTAAIASYHTSSDQVGVVAARMRADALALTHFIPPEFDRAALLTDVSANYSGPVFVGEDLMRFDLSTGIVSYADFSALLL